MTTREKILELFDLNKGIYFSGEEIAQKFNISRTAVWKAVRTLRNEGYIIKAVTNKGYCLSEHTDIISSQGIRKYMDPGYKNIDIHVLGKVDSTNKTVREKADHGEEEGYVVIASEQTEGRGRYGREFYSPDGTGVYFSILLRPDSYSSEEAVFFTTMAAVAVCEAIEKVSDEKPRIKWVNDIYIKGKKVCGILTEASLGVESGTIEYIILGLGVNMYPPEHGFPEELKKIAGSVLDSVKEDTKNHFIAAFLNSFLKYYNHSDHKAHIKKYKQYSFVQGKEITVIKRKEEKTAYACDIDDLCRLKVRYEDGTVEKLSFGEIKIKCKP